MSAFGAIIAVCLLCGVSVPLDPVVLHYFINGCDLHSIHPQILGEWHPTLKKTIMEWLDVGPHGDVGAFQGHFAIFHDMQVRTEFCFANTFSLSHICQLRLLHSMTVMKHLMMRWRRKCFTEESLAQNHQTIRSCWLLNKDSSSHVATGSLSSR